MNRILAALSLVLLSGCHPAFAAEAVGAAASWPELFREVALAMASAIVTAAITIAAAQFTRWTGIEVEAKHREALHSAAMTGINLAMSRYGATVGLSPDGRSDVVQDALGWILTTGAPRAVVGLKLTDGEVRDLVESKLGALASASATLAVTTGPTPAGA